MAFWLFKCDPKQYQIDKRLHDPHSTITWSVSRHRNQIRPGDIVFLWANGKGGGIRAVMRVDEPPRDMLELESEQGYWIGGDTSFICRVVGTLTNRISVTTDFLRAQPVWEKLPVKSGQQGTNFPIADTDGETLLGLIERFHHEESPSEPSTTNDEQEVRSGRDWAEEEVACTVADYFDMLQKELMGERYSKKEHLTQLRGRLSNRTDGAIEYKRQNISAVLVKLGKPYILGYKPAANYQALLSKTVAAFLTEHPNFFVGFPGVSQSATDRGSEIVPKLLPEGTESPARQHLITQRVIRDTEVAAAVKRFHNFRCQVCDVRLETPGGPYAEAAHIHPLSGENPGPDQPDNVLCLCPNHHVLFDYGAFSIADDMSLLGMEGRCRILPGHVLNVSNLDYHRRNIFKA